MTELGNWSDAEARHLLEAAEQKVLPTLRQAASDTMLAMSDTDFTTTRRHEIGLGILAYLTGRYLDEVAANYVDDLPDEITERDAFANLAGTYLDDLRQWLGVQSNFAVSMVARPGQDSPEARAIADAMTSMLQRIYDDFSRVLAARDLAVLPNEEATGLAIMTGLIVSLGARFDLAGKHDRGMVWASQLNAAIGASVTGPGKAG